MREAFKFYTNFLTKKEKATYISLLIGRSVMGILDVLAILSVGYLATSIAMFATEGGNQGKNLEFIGLTLPALTAKTLPLLSGTVIVLFVAKALAAIQFTREMATRVAVIEARAAWLISRNVLGGSLERMRQVSREDLSYSVQTGTTAAFTGVLNAFANIVAEGFLFLLLSLAFLALNPLATLGMLLYFALLAFVVNLFIGKRLDRAATKAHEKVVSANRALSDLSNTFKEAAVSGVRDIFFQRIFDDRNAASRNIGIQTYLAGMPRHVIETGMILGVGLFIFIQTQSSDLTSAAATIGVFIAGGFRIVAAMLPWQNALVMIKMNIPQARSSWKYLQLQSEYSFPNRALHLDEDMPVAVSAENLRYEYHDSTLAVAGVSFEIDAGSNVAFIGPSGSGKSTIADLILGLASPTSGHIKLSGKPATQVTSENPGIAGYVPQDPGVLEGTIIDNITMCQPKSEIDMDHLEKVVEDSNLREFIVGLPQGLSTKLSSHSSELSGGQRQRIGIARALYLNPGLLVLDEATSALDATIEREVTEVISRLRGRVTVITIAHRLNAVKNADKVFYLENGKIEAVGTLLELEANNPKVAAAIKDFSIFQREPS